MESAKQTITQALEFIDPHHQGECWPNPIAWDGRALRVQAGDIAVLIESYLTHPHNERHERRAISLLKRLRRAARIR